MATARRGGALSLRPGPVHREDGVAGVRPVRQPIRRRRGGRRLDRSVVDTLLIRSDRPHCGPCAPLRSAIAAARQALNPSAPSPAPVSAEPDERADSVVGRVGRLRGRRRRFRGRRVRKTYSPPSPSSSPGTPSCWRGRTHRALPAGPSRTSSGSPSRQWNNSWGAPGSETSWTFTPPWYHEE